MSNTTDAARTLATQCGAVFGRRLSVDLRFGAELVVTPHRRHPPRAHLDQSQGLDPVLTHRCTPNAQAPISPANSRHAEDGSPEHGQAVTDHRVTDS